MIVCCVFVSCEDRSLASTLDDDATYSGRFVAEYNFCISLLFVNYS